MSQWKHVRAFWPLSWLVFQQLGVWKVQNFLYRVFSFSLAAFLTFFLWTISLQSENCDCNSLWFDLSSLLLSLKLPDLCRPAVPHCFVHIYLKKSQRFLLNSHHSPAALLLAESKTITSPEDASVACQRSSLKIWTHCLQSNWCKFLWGNGRRWGRQTRSEFTDDAWIKSDAMIKT